MHLMFWSLEITKASVLTVVVKEKGSVPNKDINKT